MFSSWLKFGWWSPGPFDRLPDDLVVKILGNLSIGDRFRMRLVCKSWRSILTRPDLPVKPEPPWEILFHEPEDQFLFRSEVQFRSIDDQRTYTFKLPNSVPNVPGSSWYWWRWHCCGSGGGWLLIAGHNGFRTEMMLWDPICRATVPLPPLSTLPFFNDDMWEDLLCNFTARAVVFSIDSVECIVGVVFVFGGKRGLGLCTPWDRKWIILPEDLYLQDILFHNGKLYVVHNFINMATTETDTSDDEPVIRKTDHLIRLSCCDVQVVVLGITYGLPNYEQPYRPLGFNVHKRYSVIDHLVGSTTTGGELLIVSAIVDLCTYMSGPGGPVRSYKCPKTGGFEVRRFCVNENDGSCYLEKMRDLGDQYVLLGVTGSTCVAGDGQRRNFISFVTNDIVGQVYDDDEGEGVAGPAGKPCVVHEIGVFYMANEEIEIEYSVNLKYPPGLFAGFFAPKYPAF